MTKVVTMTIGLTMEVMMAFITKKATGIVGLPLRYTLIPRVGSPTGLSGPEMAAATQAAIEEAKSNPMTGQPGPAEAVRW